MSSIDQQFIEFIVKSLVGKPDAVSVERSIDEKGVLLELTVDPEDLGRVIGKRGATAQSLRTLLRALGTKNDARYNLKIIDNGVDFHRSDNSSTPNDDQTAPQRDDTPTPTDNQTDDQTAEPEADMPAKEEETHEEPVEETKDQEEIDHEDVVSKTRKELEDLDDLDV
jgi:predicted RNA-binding protein YlqC (UPF0109 family)